MPRSYQSGVRSNLTLFGGGSGLQGVFGSMPLARQQPCLQPASLTLATKTPIDTFTYCLVVPVRTEEPLP